jgi:hypothetical protein
MDSFIGHEDLRLIIDSITEKISREIIFANRIGNLDEVLNKYNHLVETNTESNQTIVSPKKAKVLVLGYSQVSKNNVLSTFSQYGIPNESIEIIDEESKISQFDINQIMYSQIYTDLLIGPIKHSMKNKGEFGSIIEYITANQHAFPQLNLMLVNGQLKITKTSLKTAIEKTNIIRLFKKI